MSTTDIVDSLLPEIETDAPPPEPEVTVTTDPPADKEPQSRGEDGKFKGKEPEKADKAPEAKPEPKVEAKPEPKERTIPLAAHLEERKALKAELDAMKAELAALRNPPKAPEPEPAYEQDPKGYTDHKLKGVLQQLEQIKGETSKQIETTQQTAQQAQEQALQQRFIQDVQAAEAAFVKENPDYYDALAHMRSIRLQQLQIFNPEMTQEQMVATIRQEELGMAMQLARAGKNPISSAFQLAQAYGYQRKQAKAAEGVDLPKVPKQAQLPPDQTLGSGGAGDKEVEVESTDPFEDAFKEMFARKRA